MQVTEIMINLTVSPTTKCVKSRPRDATIYVGNLLIVEDMASRKLIGVITDREYFRRILVDRDPDKTTLQDCMTHSNLLCCKASDDVEQVLEAMAKRHLRRVPVVSQGNRVEGIITDRDLLGICGDRLDRPLFGFASRNHLENKNAECSGFADFIPIGRMGEWFRPGAEADQPGIAPPKAAIDVKRSKGPIFQSGRSGL